MFSLEILDKINQDNFGTYRLNIKYIKYNNYIIKIFSNKNKFNKEKNIIQKYNSFIPKVVYFNNLYIVYQYINLNFSKILYLKLFNENIILNIFKEIANKLKQLHDMKLIHGNTISSNFLIEINENQIKNIFLTGVLQMKFTNSYNLDLIALDLFMFINTLIIHNQMYIDMFYKTYFENNNNQKIIQDKILKLTSQGRKKIK